MYTYSKPVLPTGGAAAPNHSNPRDPRRVRCAGGSGLERAASCAVSRSRMFSLYSSRCSSCSSAGDSSLSASETRTSSSVDSAPEQLMIVGIQASQLQALRQRTRRPGKRQQLLEYQTIAEERLRHGSPPLNRNPRRRRLDRRRYPYGRVVV